MERLVQSKKLVSDLVFLGLEIMGSERVCP